MNLKEPIVSPAAILTEAACRVLPDLAAFQVLSNAWRYVRDPTTYRIMGAQNSTLEFFTPQRMEDE